MTANRALAAMQFAKEQKTKDQPEPATAPKSPSANPFSTPKTELKPAYLNNSSLEQAKSGQSAPPKADQPKDTTSSPSQPIAPAKKPDFVRVDLSIAGTPHRISCPSSEVATVNKNADRLNESLREIRRSVGSKNPTNEDLLVLHCLELYDQINDLKRQIQDGQIHNERSNALLDKLIKDAQSVIKP